MGWASDPVNEIATNGDFTLYHRHTRDHGNWRNFRLVSKVRGRGKFVWYVAWNGERLANTPTDVFKLKNSHPEIHAWLIETLKARSNIISLEMARTHDEALHAAFDKACESPFVRNAMLGRLPLTQAAEDRLFSDPSFRQFQDALWRAPKWARQRFERWHLRLIDEPEPECGQVAKPITRLTSL